MATDTRATVDYALAYAAKGWHVFPCWWIENGACACGDVSCKSPGKHPIGALVPRGHIDASIAPQRIASWWRQHPEANIAVYLGASGLVAIDIDPRNGGDLTIEQIESEFGPLLSEVEARTGGGGRHLIYRAPSDLGNLPGKLGPGVDVKLNGYVVVEPSRHLSGQQYAWEASSDPLQDAVPSPLPDWLRGFAAAPAQSQPVGAQVVAPQTVNELRSALASMRSDDRDEWVRIGHALKPLGDVGRGLWLEWSQTSDKYDARDAAQKWESFQPTNTGYQAVFAHAMRGGWVAPAVVAPAVERDGKYLKTYSEVCAEAGQLRWVVKHLLVAQSVGVMFGASGTFKSFIALAAALHVAHGMRWCGQRTTQGTVIYVAAEGSVGIAKRVQAWHQLHGLKPENADIRLITVPAAMLSEAAAIRAEIEAAGIRPALVVIDTMSQTFVGEENSANEVAEYMRAIRLNLAIAFGACVLVIHHSGHAATERPRGSSAIRANTDFLLGVFRDEKQMLATMEVQHMKDGELLDPLCFTLHSCPLGTDDDGDPITSLAARHADSAAELLEAVRKSRSSHLALLFQAIGTGRPEKDVRTEFYALMPDTSPDARRQAWHRVKKTATDTGLVIWEGDFMLCAAQQDGEEA